MPIAAEAVPGLLHVSLFLFFAGLADSTLNINTTIGLSTTIPIGICGLLYIFITLAPVIYPQSPYQTCYSGIIWYAIQKFRGRIFKDRDGVRKSVSTNMAQGQMQLSMEGTMDREGRDKRSILWLMDNLTEDAEIESFVMSMPGSLEAWAELSKKEVTHVVSESSSHLRSIRNILSFIPLFRTFAPSRFSTNVMVHRPELHSISTHRSIVTSIHERVTVREFCWRIGNFFDTCKNRKVFASDELWRMRSRACVEAMASLVSFAVVDAGWFGDTLQALEDIGSFEGSQGTRNLSLSGRDQAFAVRWTCLSIMAIRSTLMGSLLTDSSRLVIFLHNDRHRVGRVRGLDKTLEREWGTEHEWGFSSKISFIADIMQKFSGIAKFTELTVVKFYEVSPIMTRELPGVDFDFPDSEPFLRQSLELFRDPAKLRFMSCRHPLKFFEYLKHVDSYRDNIPNSEHELKQAIEQVFWPKDLLQRTMWSRGDLYFGGLGFAVELFLLSLKQLLSTYPSQGSNSALYIGAFKAITSGHRGRDSRDWFYQGYSVGTIQILLDAVASDQGFLRTFDYPDYIADAVWELLGDTLEEQRKKGLSILKYNIDSVVQRLKDLQDEDGGKYRAKAKVVISRVRTPSTTQ